jgi:hypothetical protein
MEACARFLLYTKETCARAYPLQTTLMRDGVLYVVEYPCRYDLLRLIPCRPICSRPLRIPVESGII